VFSLRALVLGGSRFIGKQLVDCLIMNQFEVSVLNRGNHTPIYKGDVKRLKADRSHPEQLKAALEGLEFDVVFDLICSDIASANLAVDLFKGKTSRYVLLSTSSVYPFGQNLSEEQFDPSIYSFVQTADVKPSYSEVRKQIEALFSQQSEFKVNIVRTPLVFGEGDPTLKLQKLIRMITLKLPIYLPKKDLRMSVIHFEDLAQNLVKVALAGFTGTVNLACETPIPVAALIKLIEASLFRTAVFTDEGTLESATVFSLKGDWFLDTSRSKGLGINVRHHQTWLNKVIAKEIEEYEKLASR